MYWRLKNLTCSANRNGISQNNGNNLKQMPQNFMKVSHGDDVTLASKALTSYKKCNIASEKITNYRVIFTEYNYRM